jgi:dTMP kinase
MDRGKFITIEGGEGAGKSTQARRLAEQLEQAGHNVLVTREPGGSKRAEEIRTFLLSERGKDIGAFAEAILFSNARDDHLDKAIRPALTAGKWVVCDRFADSTRAYQGAGSLEPHLIETLEKIIVGGTAPDLTIIIDLPADEGLKRARERQKAIGGETDGFESRAITFHDRLRQAFLQIAKDNPERCIVIDGAADENAVAAAIWAGVEERLQI